ncbi:hypothetical protein LTR62_006179 [Meristemomyces frigidus]|uniref:AB hydrolase-1 domain-containing protein n=1 Tax=Meristemomyces frigidus TaxID=1508187 RepID=A0AAN7YIQ6_9PEZI|nr:hypothetical protein LTR62_006179 [Meristemomyces frigidus]
MTTSMDKLSPNDSRIRHGYTSSKGHRWHYLDVAATTPSERGVIILIHGFPDISFAWRYQIPLLASLGLRCIAIDCMGYGQTGTSSNIADFSYKTHADAVAAIAKEIGAPRIILGGHDWGGMVVYRIAQWCPELISHVFSVATPYMPVQEQFVGTEQLVKGPLPQFGYQLQFGSEDAKVEAVVKGRKMMRKFLTGMYGGKFVGGGTVMTPENGVDLEALADEGKEVTMTPLLSEEELDYYVDQFMLNGMNGPCNWYRNRLSNFEEEKNMPAAQKNGIQQPVLFIQCTHDSVLRPEMSKNMEKSIPNLTRGEVPSSHWGLWHNADKTNEIIKNWIEGVVLGGKSKL